ncbi:unnamed protein product [Kluyveromyces dobzhanskii CBS 2104]|uniref:WGS project CCBQ000000000 data, contig 00102 n=1 Tax=Kluyveromyces dobzhanskii CBS 2104 TaxID=1427455 RepID=A0A0A8L4H4_9SACH|nr:unnamed protein product [Kluyveromyces dobzhanskii CBS 2104]
MSDDYLHHASPGHSKSHLDSGAAAGGEDDSNHGNMGPTSAILDQVDEYLNSHRHAGNDGKNGGDEPQENDEHGFISARRNTPWAMDSQQYVTEDIDMDLDHLSHALLSGNRGDDRSTTNANTDTNKNAGASASASAVGGAPGEAGKHESASFLDQDSLSPIDLSGPSPSHFQLDFSLIDENHHHQQQQQQHQQQQQYHQHNSEHAHQHHHHTHSMEPEDTKGNEHVRPDMVFSPMVSPMVMPTNSLHNTPFMGPSGVPYGNVQNTPFMAGNSSSSVPTSASKQHGQHQSKFSPLTSPALNAIEQQQQQQQQNFSLPESARKSSGTNTRSKRTPHTTPLMGPTQSNQATNTNKIIKHSPHISSRRSISKFKGGNWDDMVFKLPDSSIKNEHAAQSTSNNNSHNHTPNSTHSSSNGSNSDRMTPLSLMNYPKIILPSNSNTMPASTDESVLRATESPVIKPNKYSDNYYKNPASHRQSSVEEQGSNASGDNSQKHPAQNQSSSIQKQSYTGANTSSNGPSSKLKNNNSSSSIAQVSSPVTNTNKNYDSNANANTNTTSSTSSTKSTGRTRSVPRRSASLRGSSRSSQKAKSSSEDEGIDADAEQGNDPDAEEGDDDDDTAKKQKQVHKVAEQGRRNRLNNALKDLEALIPKELKDVAAIPSKATTVELAAQYIRQLLESNSNQ